jgi:hypothetical protein
MFFSRSTLIFFIASLLFSQLQGTPFACTTSSTQSSGIWEPHLDKARFVEQNWGYLKVKMRVLLGRRQRNRPSAGVVHAPGIGLSQMAGPAIADDPPTGPAAGLFEEGGQRIADSQ